MKDSPHVRIRCECHGWSTHQQVSCQIGVETEPRKREQLRLRYPPPVAPFLSVFFRCLQSLSGALTLLRRADFHSLTLGSILRPSVANVSLTPMWYRRNTVRQR